MKTEKGKETIVEKVREVITSTEYTCDHCKKLIGTQYRGFGHKDDKYVGIPPLEIKIFRCDKDRVGDDWADAFDFCSWKCTFRFLAGFKKEFDFITLPYVGYSKKDGSNLKDLVKFIKEK